MKTYTKEQLEALATIVKISRTGRRDVMTATAIRRTGLEGHEVFCLPGVLPYDRGTRFGIGKAALVALHEAGMIDDLPFWAVQGWAGG